MTAIKKSCRNCRGDQTNPTTSTALALASAALTCLEFKSVGQSTQVVYIPLEMRLLRDLHVVWAFLAITGTCTLCLCGSIALRNHRWIRAAKELLALQLRRFALMLWTGAKGPMRVL